MIRRFQYLNQSEMPWLATNLDTSPENPETTTVSGFFRVHFEVAEKRYIGLEMDDLSELNLKKLYQVRISSNVERTLVDKAENGDNEEILHATQSCGICTAKLVDATEKIC